MPRYYITREYLRSVQEYCAAECRGANHPHTETGEHEDGSAPLPFKILEPCVKAINRTQAGYWGYCLHNYDVRDQILSHAVLYSPNLEDAVESVSNYHAVISNAMRPEIHKNDDGSLEAIVRLLTEIDETSRFLLDASIGTGTLFLAQYVQDLGLCEFTDEDFRSEEALRGVLLDLGFVISTEDNAGCRRTVFSSELVAMERSDNHQHLRKTLLQELDRKVARIPDPTSPAEQVESYISDHLNAGVDLDSVCEHFAISRRTLSRQLQAEGTGFVTIRDDVRRKRAMELINDSRVPLKRIATVCGFNSQSAFAQAFTKWTGQTPANFRHDKVNQV